MRALGATGAEVASLHLPDLPVCRRDAAW